MGKVISLKRKVFRSLLLPISIAIAVIGAAGFYSADNEVNEVYDAQLITAANVLWSLMQEEVIAEMRPLLNIDVDDKYLSEQDREAFDENAEGRMFRVWKGDEIIISSEDSVPATVKTLKPGFSDIKYNGNSWRVYSLHVPNRDNIVVEIGEQIGVRSDLVTRIALGLIIPLLLVLPAIAFLIWRGVGQGLGDVEKLSRQVKKRSPEDLSPLLMGEVPLELETLAQSLNALLHKLEESFLREKRFAENAAHELRTPLAALKIQAQLALAAAKDGEMRSYIAELIDGVDRAARLVEELLVLAKPGQEYSNFTDLDLYREAGKVVERFAEIAVQKNIEIVLKEGSKGVVKASSDVLSPLIGNILDNAIKYTPNGGKVEVVVAHNGEGNVLLKVTDNGPGIPASEYERVFERFYRRESGVAGSGLGLAIAKNIAENLRAEINLTKSEAGQGLSVIITFPKT